MKTLRLNPDDNVSIALKDLAPDRPDPALHIRISAPIPAGHKVAIEPIPKGSPVLKYGHVIGVASRDILPGDHVHTHNVEMGKPALRSASGAPNPVLADPSEPGPPVFEGIVREDGRVATRNHIGVLPASGCAATVCRLIADAVNRQAVDACPNVDGVAALGHASGCGMAPHGPGFDHLQRCLAGYARHPNFRGVLVVGLGCEVNQMDLLFDRQGLQETDTLRKLSIQGAGGTEGAVQKGAGMVREMLQEANRIRRQPVPSSHLVIGLECGGSDAYSGITANPALGAAADQVVRWGGTVILSETPEVYGAEHLLVQRAAAPEVAEKLMERIHWWEGYTALHGAEINNNPTPGNKAGGLTTILEKSLGAVAKAGTSPLMAVYGYAETVQEKGLVFMDTPGVDLASVTGMTAGGANVICFTTGCGSVVGSRPAPVLKLASSTALAQRMPGDMDVDCGPILNGEASVEEMGRRIFQRILETASGRKTRSERWGFGDLEFVPWPVGAVL